MFSIIVLKIFFFIYLREREHVHDQGEEQGEKQTSR